MKQITQERLFTRKKIHDYSLFPLSDHNPERQHCQGQVSFADGEATLDSAAVLGKIANNGKGIFYQKLILIIYFKISDYFKLQPVDPKAVV